MTSSDLQPVRVRSKFLFEGDRKFFIKGATYGPFAPDEKGEHFGTPEKARRDLEMMRRCGINTIRVYYSPPEWLVALCGEFRVRIIVTLPWMQHVAFLDDRKIRREVEEQVKREVVRHRGNPVILAYLVGNEIPSSMVRWLGVKRVTDFVEKLIRIARDANPDCLYSYASYPPTEYLAPENADFLTYNVYLHHRSDLERYLARLQNIAVDRPLVLGEFGIDTIREGEEEQARILEWHLESVVRGGLAGTMFFAWTDEWFRGGQEILDWAFGLVTRERVPKKAFLRLEELEQRSRDAGEGATIAAQFPLPEFPRVSVLVCSYNGGRTLEACLSSLKKMQYPNYEVVLVDDGSTDDTVEIAGRYPEVRYVRQKNMGLSYARNVAAAAATGDILAYTDSDCMADPDWLYYLVGTLTSGDYAGVGGPNISPPAENWVQACVSAAPGGPAHVLMTDVVAEHIPGCNMAFYKWAFDKVGGFDVEYRKAGDDVDFCWRLQQLGEVIAFSPAAIVWHYRRFTLKAFRKQQEGYGEAESLLRFKHLIFFGPTGTARWKGRIYGGSLFAWPFQKSVVYHGVFGSGLFQSMYRPQQSELAGYLSSIEWVVLTVLLFLCALRFDFLASVPYFMLGGTFAVAVSFMLLAKLEPKCDTIRARLLVMFLAFAQPLVRGWARYFTWLKFKRTPSSVISRDHILGLGPGNRRLLKFWSEEGRGRECLLEECVRGLEEQGWSYSIDTGWQRWDVKVYGNLWWSVVLRTVTEYHGGPKCLTRVGLQTRPATTVLLLNALLLGVLLFRKLLVGQTDGWIWGGYGVILAMLLLRGLRLRRRVGEMVKQASLRCGMRDLHANGSSAAGRKPPVVAAGA